LAEQEEKQVKLQAIKTPTKVSMNINVLDLYKFEPSDLTIDIAEEHYANFALVQGTPNDVYIDFLSMPGVKRDGKMVLRGTRVFLPHSVAQKLGETLGRVLETVHKAGAMEAYKSPKAKEKIELKKTSP
jgi:hypothetical protein